MNQEKFKGHIAMVVASIIFGANVPFSKMLLPNWMSAEAMSYSRFLFGAIAFWVTSLFVHSERVPLKDLGILMLGAILGIVFNQGFFIEGLLRTTSSEASIVSTITPLLVMIISFIFLKEPITMKKTGGVFLGLIGVLAIIFTTEVEGNNHNSSVFGDVLCMGSSLSYAFFLIVTRDISKRYQPLTIMKWMFLFAAIFTSPFEIKGLVNSNIFHHAPLFAWNSFLYMLIGATFITYLLIPFSQKRIRPTTIGMYNYLQPLVASLISILMGKEAFTWIKPVAAFLIFAGVYLVTTSKSKEDVERALVTEPVTEPVRSH
ncbi:DMT family transporter [Microbacter margulisiae]|uniref:Drug/metabolite transporter (DMT)-like permease n=1 Tax=Microbacter margulisiae TaxID=1350067 RepID=A0A7W5DRK6_9PORP|nr:DMT family transporter [Microbacter margulisiae]MBB3187766.1 drug/metabolite transporter (DMT)-like permease [Microbacter margulisiae]